MVVYTLEQRWEVGLRSTYRRCLFWQKKVNFSDKAHLDLGRYINQQNCRIWDTENRHANIEKPTHPKRATVWCGFWSRGIIGLFFFENEQGEAVKVNSDCYLFIYLLYNNSKLLLMYDRPWQLGFRLRTCYFNNLSNFEVSINFVVL